MEEGNWWDSILDFFGAFDGESGRGTIPWESLLALLGGYGAAEGWFGDPGGNTPKVGYQGKIPRYTAVRNRTDQDWNPFRPSGASGQYYFSPVIYAPEGEEEEAKTQASNAAMIRSIQNNAINNGVAGLYDAMRTQYTPQRAPLFAPPPEGTDLGALYPPQMPAPAPGPMQPLPPYQPPQLGEPIQGQNPNLPPVTPTPTPTPSPTGPGLPGKGSPGPAQMQDQAMLQQQAAQQNNLETMLAALQQSIPMQGKGAPSYRNGGIVDMLRPQDGMSDSIPAMINGQQPAALSGGEFVVPADVVSHLGNGNTNAGASALKEMMMRVRKARTGAPAQGPRINPNSFMPRG